MFLVTLPVEIMVAHPLEEASKAVLPKGSSHFDGTTAISVLARTLVPDYETNNPIQYDFDDQ